MVVPFFIEFGCIGSVKPKPQKLDLRANG